jgi:hypothetical protein
VLHAVLNGSKDVSHYTVALPFFKPCPREYLHATLCESLWYYRKFQKTLNKVFEKKNETAFSPVYNVFNVEVDLLKKN